MKKSPLLYLEYESFKGFIFHSLNDIRASNPSYQFDEHNRKVLANSRVMYTITQQTPHHERYLKLKEGGWGRLLVGYTYKQYDINAVLNEIYSTYTLNEDERVLLRSIMKHPYLKIQFNNSERTRQYDIFFNFLSSVSKDVTFY